MVVNWINGLGPLQVITLSPWIDIIRSLLFDLNGIQFLHIPRFENVQADALSKRALSAVACKLYFEVWVDDLLRDTGWYQMYGP